MPKRVKSQPAAANGRVASNRQADTTKAVLDSTDIFSVMEKRLINEGLVAKKSHSNSTQPVPTTTAIVAIRRALNILVLLWFGFMMGLSQIPKMFRGILATGSAGPLPRVAARTA
jgi:hypothetical protein